MWVRIRRKKLKVLRRDVTLPSRSGLEKEEISKPNLIKLRGAKINRRYTLVFELIEPIFDKNKRQPRQRTKYLGSINEEELRTDYRREQFWEKIDKKLSRLKLDSTSRSKIREKINGSVPLVNT